MSAVGDSGTSKSRTSHIKQATLIPALLLGSGEGASEEPPILLSFSLLPLTPGPALSFPFSPRLLLLMPREPARTRRCHTMFNRNPFLQSSQQVESTVVYSGADRSPFLILREIINQHTHSHTEEKCNMMSKQLLE